MKPVKQSELVDAIMVALGIDRVEESATNDEAEEIDGLPPLRSLLAEDSVVNQKLAVGLLEKHGHSVEVAGNGQEAIEAWEMGDFDVVLMDVQMPELDGLAATKEIRRRERVDGRHIPIIAMTAHAMKGDREAYLGAGMDDYVAKPIRSKELFDALSRALSAAC